MSALGSRGPSQTDPRTRRAFESLRADELKSRNEAAAFRLAMDKEIASIRAELGAAATGAAGDVGSFLEEIVIIFGGGDADG